MTSDNTPSQNELQFFLGVLYRHTKVREVNQISAQLVDVIRHDGSKIRVYLTDLYTVGVADYINIMTNHRDVNCVVSVSNYNSFSQGAKNLAITSEVGLFEIGEFMGAIHHYDYWNYPNNQKDSGGPPCRVRVV